MHKPVKSLLTRSFALEEALFNLVSNRDPYPEKRYVLGFRSGMLSLEHHASFLCLVKQELVSSAIVLVRPQFECLVRGMWLAYAADELWITKLSAKLSEHSAQDTESVPMLAKMLDHLQQVAASPKEIVQQLLAYKDVSLKALNSFSHGGMHPLSRTVTGYPEKLIWDVMRSSNALAAITGQLLTILTGRPDIEQIRSIHKEFKDCLPIAERNIS